MLSVVGATFDINHGATVSHETGLPLPSNVDRDHLADLMIPDGCDSRDSDFTFFILRPSSSHDDRTVLAGDDFVFLEPGREGCTKLDLSEQVEFSGDDFNSSGTKTSKTFSDNVAGNLFGLSVVCRRFDSSVSRGAVIRALAVICPYVIIDALRPVLVLFLQSYMRSPTRQVIDELYTLLQGVEWLLGRNAKQQLFSQDLIGHMSGCPPQLVHLTLARSIGDVSRVPISLPTAWWGGIGSTQVKSLCGRLGVAAVVSLFHSVISGQRILVTGKAAGSVSEAVSTIAALVVPSISFERIVSRLFPYAALSNVSFVDVAGYIAGTTNPRMGETIRWDMHVNLSRGTLRAFDSAHRGKSSDGSPVSNFFSGLDPFSGRVGKKLQAVASNVATGAAALVYGPGDDGARLLARLESGLALDLPECWFHEQFRVHTRLTIDAAQGDLPTVVHVESAAATQAYWKQMQSAAAKSGLIPTAGVIDNGSQSDAAAARARAAMLASASHEEELRRYARMLRAHRGQQRTVGEQPDLVHRRAVLANVLSISTGSNSNDRNFLHRLLAELSSYGVQIDELSHGITEEPLRSELIMLSTVAREYIRGLALHKEDSA